MFFGAHVSIAGGLVNAPDNAAAIGAEVFQFFSRSPQGGPAQTMTVEMVDLFRERCDRHHQREWVIHAPYYINFASGEERTRKNSARLIREELERGSLLGARYVMFHPGSARDVGDKRGMAFVISGLKRVLDGYQGSARLLIELSAGAGMVLGDTFEQVAEMLEGVGHAELGVCFDTAHAFASGYDLRTQKTVDAVVNAFDHVIGLKRLFMSHCNDSKIELGGHKDRHEHIGEGRIGRSGLAAFIRHPKLAHLNWYLETDPDRVTNDLSILREIRANA